MADNPQAFPTGDHVNGGHDGMTLLDYFAGQALAACVDHDYGNDWGKRGKEYPALVARRAYTIAAAMLNERQSCEG